MSKVTREQIYEVVEKLKDLAKDLEFLSTDAGDDDTFRQAHKALWMAINVLEALEDGRVVMLPNKIRRGDKVGDWLIAGVDFGSKMERVEAYHLIRESYLDEYIESTRTM